MEQNKVLLEIQKLLGKEQGLEKDTRLLNLKKDLRKLKDSIENAEARYQKVAELMEGAKKEAENLEKQINNTSKQIKDGKEKLYSSKGSGLKELLGLQQSLQNMMQDAQNKENTYWEKIKEADNYKAELKELNKAVKTLKAQYNQGVVEYKELKKEVDLKIAELRIQKEELISLLNPKSLSAFRQLEKRYPYSPIASLRHGNCSACHISLPTHLIQMVKEEKDISFCDNCGRILVQ